MFRTCRQKHWTGNNSITLEKTGLSSSNRTRDWNDNSCLISCAECAKPTDHYFCHNSALKSKDLARSANQVLQSKSKFAEAYFLPAVAAIFLRATSGNVLFSKTYWKIIGATIVASDSMMKRGVVSSNLPQVIFSFGTAPL